MSKASHIISLLEEEGTIPAFAKKIVSAYEKEFPKGWVETDPGLSGSSFFIRFGIQPKDNWISNIKNNDPAFSLMRIRRTGEEKYEVEMSQGGGLYIKPPEGSHLALGKVKFGWRKKTGSLDQLEKHIVSYFKKMKKVIMDNKDNMKPDHAEGVF